MNFNLKMNVQMIFDQLLSPLSHLFDRKEISGLFEQNGIDDCVLRHHNRNSWTAIGAKKHPLPVYS